MSAEQPSVSMHKCSFLTAHASQIAAVDWGLLQARNSKVTKESTKFLNSNWCELLMACVHSDSNVTRGVPVTDDVSGLGIRAGQVRSALRQPQHSLPYQLDGGVGRGRGPW